MNPELLGFVLPAVAAGICLLLMIRVVTAALKLLFLILLVALLLQIAASLASKPVKLPAGIRKAGIQFYDPRLFL